MIEIITPITLFTYTKDLSEKINNIWHLPWFENIKAYNAACSRKPEIRGKTAERQLDHCPIPH